ncbi:MAG: hypothetical protein PHC75_04990 [Burkholderiales bacterium]|nr:hypothetical protein [Burkholderiales bacterium]
MIFNKNHPVIVNGIREQDTIKHHGLSYKIIDEDFGYFEVEPERLMAWKKRNKY